MWAPNKCNSLPFNIYCHIVKLISYNNLAECLFQCNILGTIIYALATLSVPRHCYSHIVERINTILVSMFHFRNLQAPTPPKMKWTRSRNDPWNRKKLQGIAIEKPRGRSCQQYQNMTLERKLALRPFPTKYFPICKETVLQIVNTMNPLTFLPTAPKWLVGPMWLQLIDLMSYWCHTSDRRWHLLYSTSGSTSFS